jgi:hypothetical protein
MQEQLSCRGCRHPLTSDAGCALCLPVKVHLVVTSAVDEDTVPLAQVAQEAVSILRKQMSTVKTKVAAATDYDPILAAEARSIANTIAKLLDSARKVVQDGAEAVEVMSFQEKAALFLEWTASLPGAYRRRLIDSLIGQSGRAQEEPPHDDESRVN